MRLNFQKELIKYGEDEIPVRELIEKLMKDKVKADKSKLPCICKLDWEYKLSSIFVEVDTPLVNTFLFNIPNFQLHIKIEPYMLKHQSRDGMAPGAVLQCR